MSHRKRILKKENLRKHMGVCRRMGWDGWTEWAPQWGKDMAGIRGREGWQGQSAGVGKSHEPGVRFTK